jgi:hypothetical protein
MKTLTPHPGVLRYGLGLTVFGMIAMFAFIQHIPVVFHAHWLLLGLVAILLVTPWANQRAPLQSDTAKRFSFLQACGLTVAMEGTLLLVFYAIAHVVSATLPTQPPINSNVFTDSLYNLTYQWGLFPWGAYALLAAAVAYTCYIKRQAGDMSSILRPLLKSTPADISSIFVDFLTKLSILFALGSSLALLLYEIVGLIAQPLALPVIYGARLDLMIIIMLLINSCRGNFVEKRLRWLSRHGVPSPVSMLILLLPAALVILLVSALLPQLTPQLAPNFATVMPLPAENSTAIWRIFTGIWWLSWAPLAAGLLAYVWRGYRVRTLLIMPLLLPAALAAVLYVAPSREWLIPSSHNLLNLLPAILGLAGVLLLFLRQRYLIYSWKAKLSANNLVFKGNPATFLARLAQIIILVGGCFWVGGIQITSVLYFALNYVTVMFVFAAAVALGKVLLFKQRN